MLFQVSWSCLAIKTEQLKLCYAILQLMTNGH